MSRRKRHTVIPPVKADRQMQTQRDPQIRTAHHRPRENSSPNAHVSEPNAHVSEQGPSVRDGEEITDGGADVWSDCSSPHISPAALRIQFEDPHVLSKACLETTVPPTLILGHCHTYAPLELYPQE